MAKALREMGGRWTDCKSIEEYEEEIRTLFENGGKQAGDDRLFLSGVFGRTARGLVDGGDGVDTLTTNISFVDRW